MTGADVLSYVYAVARGDPAEGGDVLDDDGSAVHGVGGTPVRWVAAAGLRAAVGDVDRAQFTEAALSDHLEDLSWLAATARAHHHVVDTLGRVRLLAPLALATVYFDDDRVREVLAADRSGFDEVLDRLAGCAEFGVKVHARPAGAGGSGDRPTSGAAYLRSRRDALRDARSATDRAREEAAEIDHDVAVLAVDTRTHRLQDAALSGTAAPMVLNRAYLVPVERAGQLAALIAGLAEHPRLQVELTGPWVPYSFAQTAVPSAP